MQPSDPVRVRWSVECAVRRDESDHFSRTALSTNPGFVVASRLDPRLFSGTPSGCFDAGRGSRPRTYLTIGRSASMRSEISAGVIERYGSGTISFDVASRTATSV